MNLQYVLALSVFTSYFCLIIGLFLLIINHLYNSKISSNLAAGKAATFAALTVLSFAHTWFYMFKYMAWSFANYEKSLQTTLNQDFLPRIASWLYETSLFEEAWSLVCFHPLNWWWSEQLCTFTVGAWTMFIAIEGNRRNIKHLWAYMLLGQIVAISVASNLFYIALTLAPPSPRGDRVTKTTASPRLWTAVLLSLATVAISPLTSHKTFLPNLLVMHALAFIPLIGPPSTNLGGPSHKFSIDTRHLFRIIQFAAAGIHIRTVMAAITFLKQSSPSATAHIASVSWSILHSNPAQSSIGWDVVWTTISFVFWMFSRRAHPLEGSKFLSMLYLLLATPVSSVGVTAPYVLRPIAEPVPAKED